MSANGVSGRRIMALRAVCLTVAVMLVAVAANAATSQAATPAWKVLAVAGPTHLPTSATERQQLTVPAFGFYTLGFGADTTPNLFATATAADIEAALNALPSIAAGGGSVSVTPGPSALTFVIAFDGGPLAGTDVPLLTYTSFFGGSVAPAPSGHIVIYPFNVGGVPTSGLYTVSVTLPPGISTAGPPVASRGDWAGVDWDCGAAGAGQTTFSCTRSHPVQPGTSTATLSVPVSVSPGLQGAHTGQVTMSGGGAVVDGAYDHSITVSDTPARHGVAAFFAGAFDENGNPETRAGAHPFSAIAMFSMNTAVTGTQDTLNPVGILKRVDVDLPVGFLANPLATVRCPRHDWFRCSTDQWIGDVSWGVGDFDDGFARSRMANVLPTVGSPAQLTFENISTKTNTTAKLRPTDYGVTSLADNLNPTAKTFSVAVALWGQPGNSVHDPMRCVANVPALSEGSDHNAGTVCSDPVSSTNDNALLTNPTDCSGNVLTTLIATGTYDGPPLLSGPFGSDSPAVTGCEDVPFDPTVSTAATSAAADAASGLNFDMTLPQNGLTDLNAIATSHLKDVRVELPDGVAVNPSGATGLAGCSDAEMGQGSLSAPACPDGSKIGAVRITSPVVDHAIGGAMYLGSPKSTDPASGDMLRLWVVARDDDLGVMIKLPGSATADPATGKLVATFENNPRLPFDHLSVALKGGDRGVLAMPPRCNGAPDQYRLVSSLTPWSRAHLVDGDGPGTQDPVDSAQSWVVDQACAHGFNPGLKAGMNSRGARKGGAFSFEFTRPQGDQTLRGLTAELPTGLLASVKDVPLCTNAQADAGNCPAASRIGTVDASAGSGDPFVLEQKGEVFLTEGYKGGPYGLVVKVRAIAGPFRGAMELTPIIVRQKIEVDPTTAEVRAISDPFPTIWHGVPLRVRRVLVNVDRPNFMVNPSDCSAKQVKATLLSADGTRANRANHFQAADCAALPFKPKLALRLTGRKQTRTGKHPGVRATVRQKGIGEAGIEQAVVRLPKSLALDPDNAQALCEFEDGIKPDLENHCPKGSIVGRARAVSPLLNDPLVGNVYFVKNIRIDKKTGNVIRTLPMIIVALRGEIAINLKGESDTTKAGKLVNTFDQVPDAPVSRFNLNIKGGSKGILAVTRTHRSKINLCARPKSHTAEADIDGHNGKRHDSDVRMKTPCRKKSKKAVAKRKAADNRESTAKRRSRSSAGE